jgi:hypothetical protein
MNEVPFYKRLKFWEAVVFILVAVGLYFKPDLPFNENLVLALVLAVLRLAGINPSAVGLR